MHRRTTDLEGDELDLAVAIARGFSFVRGMPDTEEAVLEKCRNAPWRHNPSGSWSCMRCCEFDNFSRDWEIGGQLLEEARISLSPSDEPDANYKWHANIVVRWDEDEPVMAFANGPTPLVAAMRCYLLSKFGDEVDLPEGII